ncbi:type II toxin-antitoxin system HicB family antitoxin [Roseicyclus sp.]|uniref:type II toxin-antitoxin system HicB family antitoxin n=1 Tax=Roseicyclus sp. TaxID=1914329 RepID=UPI003FA0F42C
MARPEEYAIVVVPLSEDDGGGYYGFVPDLPGCASDGDTQMEAFENTVDALHEWLHEQELRGVAVPEPGAASRAAVDREKKLLDALKSLAEYRDEADERSNSLEVKLAELIALLKGDRGNLPSTFLPLLAERAHRKKLAH